MSQSGITWGVRTVSIRSRFIKHVLLPLDEWREGRQVLSHLQSLEQSQFDDAAILEQARLQKMRRLLRHAFHNTSFYRRRFQEAGAHPDKINDLSDLARYRSSRKRISKAISARWSPRTSPARG